MNSGTSSLAATGPFWQARVLLIKGQTFIFEIDMGRTSYQSIQKVLESARSYPHLVGLSTIFKIVIILFSPFSIR